MLLEAIANNKQKKLYSSLSTPLQSNNNFFTSYPSQHKQDYSLHLSNSQKPSINHFTSIINIQSFNQQKNKETNTNENEFFSKTKIAQRRILTP